MTTDRREAILARYEAVLAFFRVRLTGHDQEFAEDLAQDTVLAALKALSDQDRSEIVSASQFVLGIARHKLDDFLRSRYRRGETSLEQVLSDGDLKSVTERNQLVKILEEELRGLLVRAASHLAAEEKQFLVLRYVEGLSNADAARKLGLEAGEASRLKYRALAKLRARVERRLGDSAGSLGGRKNR